MMKKRYYKKVWGMVGFIVNLSQMIEYNLANILALNEILVAFDKEDSMYEFEYVELLRKTYSDVELTTDIIVGFPGETEEEFKITYNYLNIFHL